MRLLHVLHACTVRLDGGAAGTARREEGGAQGRGERGTRVPPRRSRGHGRRLALGAPLLLALAPGVASASPPVGTCTSSYTELTFDQVGMLPDGTLAQSVFPLVNHNGDVYICYKPYVNGPHNGHFGNFVDNTAAPHQ